MCNINVYAQFFNDCKVVMVIKVAAAVCVVVVAAYAISNNLRVLSFNQLKDYACANCLIHFSQ